MDRAGPRAIGLVLAATLLLAACGTGPSVSTTHGPQSAGAPNASKAQPNTRSIRVVYSVASGLFTPLFVGVDDGIFRHLGLDVTLVKANGAPAMAALKSGNVQIGTPGAVEVANFDSHGGHAIMLATFSNYGALSLYAARSIPSIADLAGKPIASIKSGTTPYEILALMLRRFHLQGRVQIVQVGTMPATLATMENGEAVAGILAAPTTAAAATAGFRELINGTRLGIPFSLANITVTKGYLAQHPTTVQRFLQGYVQAWHFVRQTKNRPACIAAIAHWAHVSRKLATAAYAYYYGLWKKSATPKIQARAVESVLQVNSSPKVRTLKPSSLIDNALLDKVLSGA